MIRALTAALAACSALAAVPAANAQGSDTRSYYLAQTAGKDAPRQLSDAEQAFYREVFRAIRREDWGSVEAMLSSRPAGLLHPVAWAEYYLAPTSPRIELPALQAWLATGTNLPQAERIARLSVTRGAEFMPDLPYQRSFSRRSGPPKRIRPRSVSDGTMPGSVSNAINERIKNDDPDGARILLDGVDSTLSGEARAEWRQKVAWSYFIENRDADALAMAQTVSAGSGPWVAEGEWVVGLAAWRLGDCTLAQSGFERAAYSAENPELRAAAYYWASRSATRCRKPEMAAEFLRGAAGDDQTLYGMLAAEQLGRALPDRVESPHFDARDWEQVGGRTNVQVAIALAEIGEDELSSQVLLHEARIGNTQHYPALSRLARDLGFPQTQLYMAYNAPDGQYADPAVFYPVAKWQPVTGWQVDPALAYAHTLQESNFRARAVSPAQAQGLMQITPITVRQHAPSLNMSTGSVDIFDPGVNLAFGQRNLEMLRDNSAIRGQLPKIMAAYNAGLTPITRWNSEINDQGDPLLWMESIPYWETRGYVAIVMRNYWMYERQAQAVSSSRKALAENAWPDFPGAQGGADSRVMGGQR
ncbi:lytic transglycosylase domain-containing protein [Paraurantiacibacter namhicola]|uniref:Soluble lytic murein transglycosylase n=1 Tax=Paraurantiacibacter namhicola TaxID=645517 RepID=A0A1C7D9K8_9SPHN|nr:lytic transglycosylase domain-containing protein [Paraurantiacibacter namhicola]ANU08154.1 Soluble lytic murein transglycosylase precursor [Paraurantiacibacter namhicola]